MEAVKILDRLVEYFDMAINTDYIFHDEQVEEIYKLEDELYKLIKDKEIKDEN